MRLGLTGTSVLTLITCVRHPVPALQRHPAPRCGAFSDVSFEALRKEQVQFVAARDWEQFHTPRSLALAMVGEVGEVCELLQWRSDEGAPPGLPDWSDEDRAALGDELSDVLSYVMRIADVAEIDLPTAFLEKMAKNKAKYPADQVRGSAAKYTEYRKAAKANAAVAAPADATDAETQAAQEVEAKLAQEDKVQVKLARQADAYARAQARVAQKLAAQRAVAADASDDTLAVAADPATADPTAAAELKPAAEVPPVPPASTVRSRQAMPSPEDGRSAARRAADKVAEQLAASDNDAAEALAALARAQMDPTLGRRADGADEGEDDESDLGESATATGVEVESLDELWSFMAYDQGADGM